MPHATLSFASTWVGLNQHKFFRSVKALPSHRPLLSPFRTIGTAPVQTLVASTPRLQFPLATIRVFAWSPTQEVPAEPVTHTLPSFRHKQAYPNSRAARSPKAAGGDIVAAVGGPSIAKEPIRAGVKRDRDFLECLSPAKPNVKRLKLSSEVEVTEREWYGHLRKWIAYMLSIYVVRGRKQLQRKPHVFPSAVHALADALDDLLLQCPLTDASDISVLAVHAFWFVEQLAPNGLVEAKDLLTKDGLLAAKRLFLLCWTLATKWHCDGTSLSLKLNFLVPQYGKGYTRSGVLKIDLLALEALDHSLYVSPEQYDNFRLKLVVSSGLINVSNAFYDTHQFIARRLAEVASTASFGGPLTRVLRDTLPSASSLRKLEQALLLGLDSLSSGCGLEPHSEWNPSKDEVVQSYGRHSLQTDSVYSLEGRVDVHLLSSSSSSGRHTLAVYSISGGRQCDY